MSLSLEEVKLKAAKEEIDRLFSRWLVLDPAVALEGTETTFSTTQSIQDYLETQLSEAYFEKLVRYALQRAERLDSGLRLQTTEYLYGGVRRTVEREQYTQLITMLKQYLPPAPAVSYDFYLSAAMVVIPVVLIILALSMVPVAAARPTQANLDDPTSDDLNQNSATRSGSHLQVDYEKTLRDIEVAKQQMRALSKQMGINYDTIPPEQLQQPSVDMTKATGKKIVEDLANQLVNFYEKRLTSKQETQLISKLLTDPDVIQPLNVILVNSENKELLYKIALKLSVVLHNTEKKIHNLDSLVISLGPVLITMPQDALNGSPEEVSAVIQLLFLYQSSSSDKAAISEKIRALYPLTQGMDRFTTFEIADTLSTSSSQKTIIKRYLMKFLEMAKEWVMEPLGKKSPSLTVKERLFIAVYRGSMRGILQLFYEETKLSIEEKYDLLKKIDEPIRSLMQIRKERVQMDLSDDLVSTNSTLMDLLIDGFFSVESGRPLDQNKFLDQVSQFSDDAPYTSVKVLEVLGVYSLYLGDTKSVLSHYEMAKKLGEKHDLDPEGLIAIDRFFCSLLDSVNEMPLNCQSLFDSLKEPSASLPQKQEEIVSKETGTQIDFFSPEAFLFYIGLIAGGFGLSRALSYCLSHAPAELSRRLQQTLKMMFDVDLTERSGYITTLWFTQLPYTVKNYQLLKFFSRDEQKALLEKCVSTAEFKIEVEVTEQQLIFMIRQKSWVPNWKKYLEHFNTISKEKVAIKERLERLLKDNLKQIQLQACSDVVIENKNVLVSFILPEYDASILRKIQALFRENGFESAKVAVTLDEKKVHEVKLSFEISFDAVTSNGDFTQKFKRNLAKIDEALGTYIAIREESKIALYLMKADLGCSEQYGCRLTDSQFIWELNTNASSSIHVFQYLLYTLYGIKSDVKDKQIVHNFPKSDVKVGGRSEEAHQLMKNIEKQVGFLAKRYERFCCELIFKDGKICLQISLSNVENYFGKDSKAIFIESMKKELSEIHIKIKHDQKHVLIVLSPEQEINCKLEGGFPELVKNKIRDIELKARDIELKEKEKTNEEKIDKVLEKINDRLEGFLLSKALKWGRIPETTAIGLVLKEKNYYFFMKQQGMVISREALIELIRYDFEMEGNIKKDAIILKPDKKNRGIYRLELKNPWLIDVGEGSIEQRHFKLLKPLPRLAEAFYPMAISLNYVNEQFIVSMQLDEGGLSRLQSLGLNDGKFIQKFIEKAQDILKDGVERRENEFIFSLAALNFVVPNLPQNPIFETVQQELLKEIVSSNSGEDVKGKEEEKNEDKGKEKDKSKGKGKGKEKQPVIRPSVQSETKKTSHPKGPHFFSKATVFFDENKARKDIEAFFNVVRMDLHFLNHPEKDKEMMIMEREFILYGHLSNLLEELVKCAEQFNRPNRIKPNWFNITDFEGLRRLRIEVIKNVNIPNHRTFCRKVAEKLLGFLLNESYIVNVQYVREMARTEAIISEFIESECLDTEESTIEYAQIKSLVETLKSGAKGGNLRQWVMREMNYIQALIIFTSQVFDKKHAVSSKFEMQYNLGEELYSTLAKDCKDCRNLAVHEIEGKDILKKVESFARFIVRLNEDTKRSNALSM